jgi:hypothetical protein
VSDLSKLAAREAELVAQVQAASGSGSRRTQTLEAAGVFAAYRDVHRAYVALLPDGEALKRALFIQWFSSTEPPCFSGIAAPDRDAERAVFDELERRAQAGALDAELRWMLSWYRVVSDFYFPPAERFPSLRAALESHDQPVETARRAHPPLDGRGQMGDYWRSVLRRAPGM